MSIVNAPGKVTVSPERYEYAVNPDHPIMLMHKASERALDASGPAGTMLGIALPPLLMEAPAALIMAAVQYFKDKFEEKALLASVLGKEKATERGIMHRIAGYALALSAYGHEIGERYKRNEWPPEFHGGPNGKEDIVVGVGAPTEPPQEPPAAKAEDDPDMARITAIKHLMEMFGRVAA